VFVCEREREIVIAREKEKERQGNWWFKKKKELDGEGGENYPRLLPVVRLGDVSELLLDGVSVDVGETEGLRGGGGQTAPLGRVPTAGGAPHRVHGGSLDLVDGLLDGVKAVHESRIRLRKGDVQQLSVVVFVLNNFKVGVGRCEEHHFGCWTSKRRSLETKGKDRGFGSARKALYLRKSHGLADTPSSFNRFKQIETTQL